MAQIPIVDVDPQGVFKYILIEYMDGGRKKTLVRGYNWADYHDDIFQRVNKELRAQSITSAECVGGGRIDHQPDLKKLKVYGFSQAFGQGDHALAVELIREKYPDYDLSWSNDGY